MPLLYSLPSPLLLKLFGNGVEYDDYDTGSTGIFARAHDTKIYLIRARAPPPFDVPISIVRRLDWHVNGGG